ncbi:hypothetical protein [Saccharothrix syringae]|uniref:hypothetical protein n=1 Tax=Saccharothrix syringae TaxID=103733 RepID=UPI001B808601|nr:hypothetical protein [Saccharothrix syringae]
MRERTTRRADSTHLLAAVRDLTRLELVAEAVRAVLEEPARDDFRTDFDRPRSAARGAGSARADTAPTRHPRQRRRR